MVGAEVAHRRSSMNGKVPLAVHAGLGQGKGREIYVDWTTRRHATNWEA